MDEQGSALRFHAPGFDRAFLLARTSKEWRNVKLFGQERNLMTSSIARMNCFLHGIEDCRIERGDTLSDPKFVEGGRLQRFDVVLANPPYCTATGPATTGPADLPAVLTAWLRSSQLSEINYIASFTMELKRRFNIKVEVSY
jgi:hypothetical protein